jgi:hypothetical protein
VIYGFAKATVVANAEAKRLELFLTALPLKERGRTQGWTT